MKIKLLILIFIVLGALTSVSAQSFSYSYTDPCTGITKSITVPSSGVTVSYYGQVNTFAPGDFYSGAFESWANTVYASFGGINPCAGVVGMPTATNVAQSTAINFIGQVNSLSAIADLSSSLGAVGGTNMLGGVAGSASNSSGSGGSDNKENKSNNNNTNGSNGNNSGNNTSNAGGSNSGSAGGNGSSGGAQGQEGSTSTSGSSQGSNGSSGSGGTGTGGEGGSGGSEGGSSGSTSGGSGSGTSGSGSSSGSGTGTGSSTTETSSEGGGKTNILGGSVSSVGGSSGGGSGGSGSNSKGAAATTKNGNRPSILASSDFVGFNFKNSDVSYGGKVTGGYTAMRWDGKRASGITADYTSALKGPNFTGFYANIAKKRIDLISGTVTLGFDKQKSAYGTLAVGQMWTLDKKKKAKAVYMLTGSWGNVYGTPFVGTAMIGGGMYDLKIGKRIDIKLMGLYVYAPYVSYYNDILLKSPHVVLPIVGTNIGVTKRFKININGGGAWAIGESTLNYTVMMGTRLLL